jgi:hypothetical protein
VKVFVQTTQPLVQCYRGRSVHREGDGTKTPDEVSAELTRPVAEECR